MKLGGNMYHDEQYRSIKILVTFDPRLWP